MQVPDARAGPDRRGAAHRLGGGARGFRGYDLSILRIRYLVPRMAWFVLRLVVLTILRIEGCLNGTL